MQWHAAGAGAPIEFAWNSELVLFRNGIECGKPITDISGKVAVCGYACGEDAAHSEALSFQAEALLGARLKNVLITSCRFSGDRTGIRCVGENPFVHIHERRLPPCHGSGDLFASVFAGLMLRCASVERSACAAADFTFDCLKHSAQCADHRWYGVDYEAMLPELVRRLESFC